MVDKANAMHPPNGLTKLTKYATKQWLCDVMIVVALIEEFKELATLQHLQHKAVVHGHHK